MDTSYTLEARELECIRDDRVLFSGLSFSMRSGQLLQVEGRNGAGKTTLLRMLCGLRRADDGDLFWNDESIQSLGPDYLQHVAYVGHAPGVKRDLDPLENLKVACGLGSPRDVDLEEALDKVGLYGFEDVPVRNLSAGQTRRVALARLLVTDAAFWILDEPFTAIDRDGISGIERLLEEHLERGGMVALTTHHRIDIAQSNVIHLNLTELRSAA